ncbi:hypothetical protein EIP91_003751 [Steccherinum ochraceum]|uniref:F-box domain-containing protein n=1 Tax=Steccherinum ochraceum TaxID=92696 RepID=A0A4R0RLL4_9APHY|nr:hypothetical protein EIP91_003751 [Steccherinum ochraceum]
MLKNYGGRVPKFSRSIAYGNTQQLILRSHDTPKTVVIPSLPLPVELRLIIIKYLCPTGGHTIEDRKNLQRLALASREWLEVCQLLLFKILKVPGGSVCQLVELFLRSRHLASHVEKCTIIGRGQTVDGQPCVVPNMVEILDIVALIKLMDNLKSIALTECWLEMSQCHAEHWIIDQQAFSVGQYPVPRMLLYNVLVGDLAFQPMMSLSKTLTLADVSVCSSSVDLQAFSSDEYALTPAHFANLDHFELHPMTEGYRPGTAPAERQRIRHRGLEQISSLLSNCHDHLTSFTASFNLFDCAHVSKIFAFLRLKGGRITQLNLDFTPTANHFWGFRSLEIGPENETTVGIFPAGQWPTSLKLDSYCPAVRHLTIHIINPNADSMSDPIYFTFLWRYSLYLLSSAPPTLASLTYNIHESLAPHWNRAGVDDELVPSAKHVFSRVSWKKFEEVITRISGLQSLVFKLVDRRPPVFKDDLPSLYAPREGGVMKPSDLQTFVTQKLRSSSLRKLLRFES